MNNQLDITFILVEPSLPENIGASARALKNMGFTKLTIINSDKHLAKEASWLAHGSKDVLMKAKILDNIHEVKKNFDFIIGTTSKKRSIAYDYYPVYMLKEVLIKKRNMIKNVCLLFGRENSGLTNEELKICDMITSIPVAEAYPSLNLSHAVLLYAYELSSLKNNFEKIVNEKTSGINYKILRLKLEKILHDLNFRKDSSIYNRIMERFMICQKDDFNLINSICNRYIEKNKL
ncbi:tRNA/rRNA methyltransferase [Bacteroidota bacterium]